MTTINGPLVTLRTERVERVMIAGQQSVFLPWGAYVLATAPSVQVFRDSGGGFVPLAFGADYVFQTRQRGIWPEPSTADVSTGVWLNAGAAGGETIRIDWVTGSINLVPPSPIAFSMMAVPPQYMRYNGGQPPDSIIVAARFGFQIELWKMSGKGGEIRNAGPLPAFVQTRGGRRFIPYWRTAVPGPTPEITIPFPSSFTTSQHRKNVYRVCYYDAATGARTELSAERIFYQRVRNDIVGGAKLHFPGAVWVVA